MRELFTILWIFAPVAVANMGPVIAHNIKALEKYDYPLDGYKTYRGKRIFGAHKTIRGIIAGTVFGMLTVGMQMILYAQLDFLSGYSYGVDYTSISVLFMGAALGFGALAGDAIKSFFKRQANVDPGKSWAPFDQLDFVLGAALFSLPFVVLPIYYYVIGIFITLILHPTINVIGWLLRLQDKPF